MNSLINLEEHKPHVAVMGKNTTHVIPVAMFKNIVSGKLKTSEVEDIDDFFPAIIEEWLEYLGCK